MFTSGDGPATPRRKRNLGFIELPDCALDVLSHYTQRADWEVVLVVGHARDSHVMRMAEILQIPAMEAPERLPLLGCDRVIVNDQPSSLLALARSVLDGTEIEVVPLTEALGEVRGQTLDVQPLEISAADLVEVEAPLLEVETPLLEVEAPDEEPVLDAVLWEYHPVAPEPAIPEVAPEIPDVPDDTEELHSVLQLAMHATRASGGAFLLPSGENGAWHALMREGISPENIEAFERWIGDGICREVLMSGVPRITHRTPTGALESWGEFASPEAAAVGIVRDGRVIGILAVIAETAPVVFDDDSVLILARFAKEAANRVSAIVGTGSDVGDRWEKALIEMDQLMASPENLGARLRGVADSLGRTLAADFSRVFIVEPLARRLSLAGTSQGAASWQPASQPLDRGFLGAMIRLGEVHIVGTFHERGERRAALICIPIQTQEPRALIVLENVPVPAESEEDIFRLLREVVTHTEELIATEEGVVAQELLYQLKMRVTDQIPQLAALPPVQRTHAALELALQNLAAEVAIWIPRNGGRPISTEPRSPRAIAILGQVRWSLDRIVQWVNESGSTSVGIGAEPDDAAAPVGPAPYIGVISPDNEGVLVAFFPPDEVTGSPAQVPVHVLLEVGHHISELCSPRFAEDAQSMPALLPTAPQPEAVFDLRGFRLLTRQEWLRSRRYGHEFALTRFRLAAETNDEDQTALREFLLARKRDVDLITEPEAGTCFVLSPEVDQNPEGIRDRMLREWSEAYPQVPLEADQRVFPRDGHDESIYLEWAEEPSGSQRAA